MGSGEVAIVALSTMISLKVTFSDGLGGEERHAPFWWGWGSCAERRGVEASYISAEKSMSMCISPASVSSASCGASEWPWA